jgi:hypothetical protein
MCIEISWTYVQVLFESLISLSELLNMAVFRNFEVMLGHAEVLCVDFCNFGIVIYL